MLIQLTFNFQHVKIQFIFLAHFGNEVVINTAISSVSISFFPSKQNIAQLKATHQNTPNVLKSDVLQIRAWTTRNFSLNS